MRLKLMCKPKSDTNSVLDDDIDDITQSQE